MQITSNSIPDAPDAPTLRQMPLNVVVFGESGAGKSSVINMIAGKEIAGTSGNLTSCTLFATAYDVDIDGIAYRLHDTAGLNASDEDIVPDMMAFLQLYKLLKSLAGGVSLLIFCLRGSRKSPVVKQNWKMFYEVICQKKVPIILAVTHLEKEEPEMDAWWEVNKHDFEANGMHLDGVACVTSSKGKLKKTGYVYQEEYDESQTKMKNLIQGHNLAEPWNVPSVQWFNDVISTSFETDCWGNKTKEIKEVHQEPGSGMFELQKRWSVSVEEARGLVLLLDKV